MAGKYKNRFLLCSNFTWKVKPSTDSLLIEEPWIALNESIIACNVASYVFFS